MPQWSLQGHDTRVAPLLLPRSTIFLLMVVACGVIFVVGRRAFVLRYVWTHPRAYFSTCVGLTCAFPVCPVCFLFLSARHDRGTRSPLLCPAIESSWVISPSEASGDVTSNLWFLTCGCAVLFVCFVRFRSNLGILFNFGNHSSRGFKLCFRWSQLLWGETPEPAL